MDECVGTHHRPRPQFAGDGLHERRYGLAESLGTPDIEIQTTLEQCFDIGWMNMAYKGRKAIFTGLVSFTLHHTTQVASQVDPLLMGPPELAQKVLRRS